MVVEEVNEKRAQVSRIEVEASKMFYLSIPPFPHLVSSSVVPHIFSHGHSHLCKAFACSVRTFFVFDPNCTV